MNSPSEAYGSLQLNVRKRLMTYKLKSTLIASVALAIGAITIAACDAQTVGKPAGGPGGAPGGGGRTWDVEQIGTPDRTVSANRNPGASRVSISVSGDKRTIAANNIPNHNVGSFPNGSVTAQNNVYAVDATPTKGSTKYITLGTSFGVAVNGVTFDPLAVEFYERGGQDWNYVALNGAIRLGLDTQTGHIQGGGEYHYHGIAQSLLSSLGYSSSSHSPLIGYAADGFPIYALSGQGGQSMTSSYRLKSGARPGGSNAPGGTYDGTFHADYVYVSGAGNLDECNGAMTVSAEYPSGTYAYFLSEDYPVTPICHKGTVSSSFSPRRR